MRSTIVISALFTAFVAIIYVWVSYDNYSHNNLSRDILSDDNNNLHPPNSAESAKELEIEPAKQTRASQPIIDQQTKASQHSSLSQSQIDKVESYLNQIEQSSDIKQQLAQLDNTDEVKKKQQADHLLYSVNEMFSAKRINSAEYVFLKLAIMRKVLPEEKFKQYAQSEIERQQTFNAQAMNEYLSNRDPQFLEYKAKEKALVEEILAMDTFPNNMSRNEYLTFRIEALKKEVYGL